MTLSGIVYWIRITALVREVLDWWTAVYQLWYHGISKGSEPQVRSEESLIGVKRSTFECQVGPTYNAIYATIPIMMNHRTSMITKKQNEKEAGCQQK